MPINSRPTACNRDGSNSGRAVVNVRGTHYANQFTPDGLQSRWFQLRRSVETPLVGGFQVCLKCGLVWSHVSPEELRVIIENQGTDEAKSHLPQ